MLAASAGLQASWHVLNDFKTRGVQALTDWRAQVEASPYGAMNFAQITGAAKVRELEERFMPADAQRDYANTWGHGTHLGQGDVKKD